MHEAIKEHGERLLVLQHVFLYLKPHRRSIALLHVELLYVACVHLQARQVPAKVEVVGGAGLVFEFEHILKHLDGGVHFGQSFRALALKGQVRALHLQILVDELYVAAEEPSTQSQLSDELHQLLGRDRSLKRGL